MKRHRTLFLSLTTLISYLTTFLGTHLITTTTYLFGPDPVNHHSNDIDPSIDLES